MDSLGDHYSLGQGVALDKTQAVEWYRKSAQAGCTSGMNDLANCYATGFGVAKDISQAAHWYAKSAAAGDLDAAKKLAELQLQQHDKGTSDRSSIGLTAGR